MSVMASQADHEFPLSPWLTHITHTMRGTHRCLVNVSQTGVGNQSTKCQHWPWAPRKPWWWPGSPVDHSCRRYTSLRIQGPHSQIVSTCRSPHLCSRKHRWASQTSALAENAKALGHLRAPLEWTQCDHLRVIWGKKMQGCSVGNGGKCWHFKVQWWKAMSWMPDLSLPLAWS